MFDVLNEALNLF